MTTSGFLYPFTKIRATVLMLTVFFVCAGISPVLAQGWELAVGGNGEELGEAIVVTSDWGLLAVGEAQPVDGNNSDQSVNLYAIKTDVDGTILWKRDYNLAFYERSKAIQVLPNQQYLIAAEASFVSQGGPYELLLAKIDEQGTLLDTAFFSLDEVPNLRINDMVADGDSGYFVVGYADYGADDDDDMVIIKITPELTLEWYQILDIGLNDRANAIALVEDGLVITGQIDSQVPPPTAFGDDVVTLKVNNSGEVVWQQRIATNRDDAGKDILVNDQGEVVLTGFADKDLFIWKYDENGAPLDSLKHNVYGNSNGGEGIIKTESGYVVCGFTEGSGSEVKWLIVEVEEDLSITWSSDNGVPLALNYSVDISK
ncbi:MAG: hypothetical protein HRU12_18200, partial [Phaeodactylibacter sp.]|nr:hypothetical protein [Phaeodactylibacter sp.]